jgi:hypothetical protein
MSKFKTLSAAMILSAAVATPVIAQTAHHHGRANFRGAYNQMTEPSYAVAPTQAERNIENFGFSGRDPSRVGGEDTSLKPSGS